MSLGSHNLTGPLPFGVFMYGYDEFDSYGYPGGGSLAPVASEAQIALEPLSATDFVGATHCITATVTDGQGQPLEGVRVDFAVSGSNAGVDFVSADAQGQARFCYLGANAGQDTISAAVGTVSSTAGMTWVAAPVTPTPTYTPTPTPTDTPTNTPTNTPTK